MKSCTASCHASTRSSGVPAEHSSVAYRPMESSVSLDQILCFKHRRKVARDNTVKYNWRTLQLLPGKERPSYAESAAGAP